MAERLRVAMFSTMVTAGAGSAALRVHDALRLGGADSTLYVGRGERLKHPGVRRLGAAKEGCQPPQVPGMTIFSVDPPGIPDAELDHIIAQADVFSLHWFARFLSVRNIERLSRSGKPVIITVRDMNPLTGGCHFFHGCDNWQRTCAPCPQFTVPELPLPHATFESKRALWNIDNITAVVLSDHTAGLVAQSPVLGRCRVEKIPNPMDVSLFRPYDRDRARAAFGIPGDKRVVAYLPSFSSTVKGAAQAIEALHKLSRSMPDCVVACAGDLGAPLDVPFQTIDVGFIADKAKLARFYAAADITLVPSTEETFSNTAAESVACGTPVVGFEVGAIPEIAQGARGRAVPVNDIDGLTAALTELLSSDSTSPEQLHHYVAETFGLQAIGQRYLQLFEDLRSRSRARLSMSSLGARGQVQAAEVRSFEQLLCQYRDRRSVEIDQEQTALRRERRSFRGRLSLAHRVAHLFFADNRAFRRQLCNFIPGRR